MSTNTVSVNVGGEWIALQPLDSHHVDDCNQAPIRVAQRLIPLVIRSNNMAPRLREGSTVLVDRWR